MALQVYDAHGFSRIRRVASITVADAEDYFLYLPLVLRNFPLVPDPPVLNTITPATQAQMAYALSQGYDAWRFSDCYDVGDGEYVKQGASPVAMPDPPETRPGLVTPHASGLALITPLAADALANLQATAALFDCAYDSPYGFRDSVMANPDAPDHGQCSDRYSALAQAWIFLAIVNHENDFIGHYFYHDPGVVLANVEMYGGTVYLPLVTNTAITPMVSSTMSDRDVETYCTSNQKLRGRYKRWLWATSVQ